MANSPARLRELASELPAKGQLPVLPPLASLLAADGLRRGCVIAVEQSALLCMTLAAEASAAGAWCAVVGMPDLGVVAAADAGVDVNRLLLVPDPGPRWPQVVAALLDGCELVLLRPSARPSAQVARRLAAHARRSGAILIVQGDVKGDWTGGQAGGWKGERAGGWPGAHLWLRLTQPEWVGIGAGHGRLKGRRVLVVCELRSRGAGARPQAQWWWLPDSGGAVAAAEEKAAEEKAADATAAEEKAADATAGLVS